MSEAVSRVGVVGAGQMGGGIAEVSARAGADVLVWEATEELAAGGRARAPSRRRFVAGASAGLAAAAAAGAAVAQTAPAVRWRTSCSEVSRRLPARG